MGSPCVPVLYNAIRMKPCIIYFYDCYTYTYMVLAMVDGLAKAEVVEVVDGLAKAEVVEVVDGLAEA